MPTSFCIITAGYAGQLQSILTRKGSMMERRVTSHTEEEEMNQRRKLLGLARKGDQKAISKLFELYQVKLYSGELLKKVRPQPIKPPTPALSAGAKAGKTPIKGKKPSKKTPEKAGKAVTPKGTKKTPPKSGSRPLKKGKAETKVKKTIKIKPKLKPKLKPKPKLKLKLKPKAKPKTPARPKRKAKAKKK